MKKLSLLILVLISVPSFAGDVLQGESIDMEGGAEIVDLVIHRAASAPTAVANGQVYYDTTGERFYFRENGSWNLYVRSLDSPTFTTLTVGTANAQTSNVTGTLTAAVAQIGAVSAAASHTVGNATIGGNLTLSGSSANLILGSNYVSGDGGDEGIYVYAAGNARIEGVSNWDDTPTLLRVESDNYSSLVNGDGIFIAFGMADTEVTKIGGIWEASNDFGISFKTTTDGGSNVTEKMRLSHDGSLIIGATPAYATNTLSVYGYSACYGWNTMSSSSLKTDITAMDGTPITEFERQDKPVARRFKYKPPAVPEKSDFTNYEKYQRAMQTWEEKKKKPEFTTKQIGFIVEELPEKYIAPGGNAWSHDAFIVDHEMKIQQLEKKIARLEKALEKAGIKVE